MGCGCGGASKGGKSPNRRERWRVTLPSGITLTKASEAEAKAYADAHPGAKYKKIS